MGSSLSLCMMKPKPPIGRFEVFNKPHRWAGWHEQRSARPLDKVFLQSPKVLLETLN